MVLNGALFWLLAGMSLSRLLSRFDAGISPTLNDSLVLVFVVITCTLNTVVLLRLDPRPA